MNKSIRSGEKIKIVFEDNTEADLLKGIVISLDNVSAGVIELVCVNTSACLSGEVMYSIFTLMEQLMEADKRNVRK